MSQDQNGGDDPQESPGQDAEERGMSVVQAILDFLRNIFPQLSPAARNTIGIVLALLLVVYILHGFLGPTYMRGHMLVKKTSDSLMASAIGYTVEYNNEATETNRFGNWMLPILRSGIPARIQLNIYDQELVYIDQYHFYGPWPVLNALYPKNINMKIHMYKPQGERIEIALGFLEKEFGWGSRAYAKMPYPVKGSRLSGMIESEKPGVE